MRKLEPPGGRGWHQSSDRRRHGCLYWPGDFAEAAQFGTRLFWLRARFRADVTPENRELKGVYINTVWAVNQTTITEETLGSGNGKERQTLTLLQTPVLEGEKLYVRELEAPSDEERLALEAMEARQLGKVLTAQEKDALVQTRENPLTGEPEIWVRWHRVQNFHSSDARSRHYMLDRITGVVTFGNGQQGMLPPIGRDNIRAFVYRAGADGWPVRRQRSESSKCYAPRCRLSIP